MVAQVSGEVEVVEENRVLRAFQAVDIVIGNFKNLNPKYVEPVFIPNTCFGECFSIFVTHLSKNINGCINTHTCQIIQKSLK